MREKNNILVPRIEGKGVRRMYGDRNDRHSMNKAVYTVLVAILFLFIGAAIVCGIVVDLLSPLSLSFLLLAVIDGIIIGLIYGKT